MDVVWVSETFNPVEPFYTIMIGTFAPVFSREISKSCFTPKILWLASAWVNLRSSDNPGTPQISKLRFNTLLSKTYVLYASRDVDGNIDS